MGNVFDISVCICTRNRPEALGRVLRSIPLDNEHIREILVSDDGAGDGSKDIVDCFGAATWIPGTRRGVSANRNNVALRAQGSHIWFLDDDAVALRGCLDTFARCLRHVVDPDATIISGSMVERGHSIIAGEQTYLGFQARRYNPSDKRTTVVLGNVLFPRRVFECVRFDELLQSVYEEVDFTTRAVAAGFVIVDCPNAVALHEPPQGTREYARYGPEMDVARIYVTAKRRGFTEQSPSRAMLYLLVACTHMMASQIKRGGLTSTPVVASNIREIMSRLWRYGRLRRDLKGMKLLL